MRTERGARVDNVEARGLLGSPCRCYGGSGSDGGVAGGGREQSRQRRRCSSMDKTGENI